LSSTKKPTKATALAGLQALIAGIQKHFPTGSLTVGNVVFTVLALVQLLQGQVDAMTAQAAAEKTAEDALTALRALQTKNAPTLQALKDLLIAQFGNASQTLADFGLSPRKARAPMTAAQKAAAAAKRKATRAARGTTGPKAKLAIKGTVTAPAETPPAAPATTPAKPAS
jgi:LPS O-antigen subunit length determinant protein (WzzB/FepE family)